MGNNSKPHKHGPPPRESMELVQARTWERIGKCKVRVDWSVWDEVYNRWRLVPEFNVVCEQPSPAGVHRMRWRFLNWWQAERMNKGDKDV